MILFRLYEIILIKYATMNSIKHVKFEHITKCLINQIDLRLSEILTMASIKMFAHLHHAPDDIH